MNDEDTIKEKIRSQIHRLLAKMDEATARESTALASAIKELYLALEFEGKGSTFDWLSQLNNKDD